MIILINFCLSLFSLSAQNSPDPEPGAVEEYKSLYSVEMLPPSCLNSQVKNVSIIHYSDMVSVSVEIANTEFQSTSVFIQDNEGRNQSDALTPRAGGLLTFENLKSNQSYELKGINSCGQVEVIANINTLPFKPGEAVVTSAPLYRALSAYVASERQSIPLPEYVKGLPEISLQEKIEFAQQPG